jgi:phosphomannomutase/phosphoglucomutase
MINEEFWEFIPLKKLKLFGTSGIRGMANLEMTPELAKRLGLTFASLLGNEGRVAVGRDVRLSAESLSSAFISGLLYGGVNVEDCGTTPTPAVLWALKKRELSGAAVVTGSHTPREMIGFLFFMEDTAELFGEQVFQFENIFFNKVKPLVRNVVGRRFTADISDLYLRSVLHNVDFNKINSSNFKAVLDPGNGASASLCTDVLHAAGVETIVINGEPNGLFPGRDPFPRPEVLGDLSKKVKESKADIGSATDADGDRAIFVDHKGKILWGDISGCVFVKDVLQKRGKGTIIAPINSSQLLNWVCSMYNGKLEFTPIGPSAIVNEMKAQDAIIGVEETGKNIWPESIFYGDWILSTLKMLEIMTEKQRSLTEIVKELPKFNMRKKIFHCPDALKDIVLAQVLKEWKKRGEDVEIVTLDGVRINYHDGSWLLFRPSGTEAVFRLYSESRELKKLKELEKIGSKIVRKALKYANLKSRNKENNIH